MRSRPVLVLITVASLLGSACGGAKTSDTNAPGSPGAASAKNVSDGGAGAGAGAGGATTAADAGPPAKPFAGSAVEATQLIGAAVDRKTADVQKCVAEYRTRKNLPHERVTISMGIDQEGRLLGATLPKGKTDSALSDCIQAALANAPFPRSHSGVISITKSYEEIVQ
ncbi:MAG: hypothetical protein JWP87_675 [Labilithrix sp.]|nr:hypothetical protein [Labilithrix sp.]